MCKFQNGCTQFDFISTWWNFPKLAIRCDFRYSEDDKNYPEDKINKLVHRSFAIDTTIEHSKEFVCLDEFEGNGTNIMELVKNRFEDAPPEDDLNAESLCGATKKIIRPKVMPSVRNDELLTVINHGEFSQTVTIEECEWVSLNIYFDAVITVFSPRFQKYQ